MEKKRSILDVAREHKANKQSSPTPQKPIQKQQPKPAPKTKGPPAFSGIEKVKASCGHLVDFGIWEPSKDKFREERRKKVQTNLCKTCRAEKHERELKEALKRKKARQARKLFRYPHGTVITSTMINTEQDQRWRGVMTVPVHGEQLTFTRECSGIHGLWIGFGSEWGRWLTKHGDGPLKIRIRKLAGIQWEALRERNRSRIQLELSLMSLRKPSEWDKDRVSVLEANDINPFTKWILKSEHLRVFFTLAEDGFLEVLDIAHEDTLKQMGVP